MNLGNKIVSLRKKNNLSQEELAEKVGVTRQTISKWELEETAPDINQAKTLSKIFNVSLDELTNNNINSILTEKISNTERLAGITIKILKVIGVGMLAFIIIIILLFILLNIKSVSNKDRKIYRCSAERERIDAGTARRKARRYQQNHFSLGERQLYARC